MWHRYKQTAGQRGLWEEADISPAMAQSQREWLRAFYGSPGGEDFSLSGLPATLTGFVSTLVTGELHMDCGNTPRGKFLTEQLLPLVQRLREPVQLAAACGMAVIRPLVVGNTIQFEVLGPGQIFPTRFGADGSIMAGYLADFAHIGSESFVRIESFDCDGTRLGITNRAYRVRGDILQGEVPLGTVSRWNNLAEHCLLENVSKPLFGYLRMPFANTVDMHAPLPVSLYAGAMESMREFDRVYGELLYELHSGKRKRIIERQAISPERKAGSPGRDDLIGRGYRDISPDNYIVLDPMEQAKPFDDYTPQLRTESYLTGLKVILHMVENQCHLSPGTLSLDARTGALTATEVISQDRTTYSTCTAIQESLRQALLDLIEAMDVLATLYGLCPVGKYTPSISFGDSVFEDTQQEFTRRMEMVKEGVLRPEKLLQWYFDTDETGARALLPQKAKQQEVTA